MKKKKSLHETTRTISFILITISLDRRLQSYWCMLHASSVALVTLVYTDLYSGIFNKPP